MTRHIMIDIETMGTKPGSAIVSIGAVEFQPELNSIVSKIHLAISLQSCLLLGMEIDPATVAWWRKQSPEAQAALLENPVPLGTALSLLGAFLSDSQGNTDKDLQLWCKGASFDFPILTSAFRIAGVEQPWKFWQERCCRTVFKLAEQIFGIEIAKNDGTHHNARDDAMHQATQLMLCMDIGRLAQAALELDREAKACAS